MPAHSPHSAPATRRGFALLITITLLAFLVLLLVSLASLTRVETQVAGNSVSLAQARQNALHALNIALGELQRTAGPDQRVTARADILGAATHDTNSKWTGVWHPTLPVTWLVSGVTTATANETPTPAVDDDTVVRLVGPNTATNASSLSSVNAGTDVLDILFEAARTGESSVRLRYRLGNGAVQEATDTATIITTFNRVFFRFRTRADAAAPAFRIDDVKVEKITTAANEPVATPLELWRAEHFTADELSNPALESTLWGHTADPDADGFANLLEYALALDPLVPTASTSTFTVNSETKLELSFLRARAELTYEVLASSDLATWTVVATNPGTVGQSVTFTDTVELTAATPATRFLRLKVHQP